MFFMDANRKPPAQLTSPVRAGRPRSQGGTATLPGGALSWERLHRVLLYRGEAEGEVVAADGRVVGEDDEVGMDVGGAGA